MSTGGYKMIKSEFKKLYSEYRRVHREFYQHFYQANYPCGYGDYELADSGIIELLRGRNFLSDMEDN